MAASLSVQETVSESGEPAVPVLRISGRLDASTVSILEHSLSRALRANGRVVVADLSEVNYISSSGLRVLLTVRRQARERQGDLFLCALSQKVQDVFDMVGFSALFNVSDTVQDAVASALRLQAGPT